MADKQIERKILDSFKINCNQIINNTKKEVKDYIDILKNEYGINEAITRKAINDI